jgi:hypothetical protein
MIEPGATYEELKRRLEESLAKPYLRAKPAVDVLTIPVSRTLAERARANPSGVRVAVVGSGGPAVFEPPKPNPNHVKVLVNSVTEVDANGRPIWPKAGAEHEYNPLDRL